MERPEEAVSLAGRHDRDEIIELINEIQPESPWDSDHYDWQYEQPTGGPARLYVARRGDQIVSLYAMVPHLGHVEGEERIIWMAQDVMTQPGSRGRGLLHRLGKAALEDLGSESVIAHTFPNRLSRRSFVRLGWDDRASVPQLRLACSNDSGQSPHGPTNLSRVITVHGLPHQTWESAELGNGVERSVRYLEWRYSKPRTDYEFYSIGENLGYLILKWYRTASTTRLHICELVIDSQHRHLLGSVLQSVISMSIAGGAEDLTAWCLHNHPYRSAFVLEGFKPDEDPERHIFTLGLTTSSPWHVSMGDSDVY